MNYQIMDTWFITSAEEQHLGLTADGNQYYLDIYAKNDDCRNEDGSLDAVCSGRFATIAEAMDAYLDCVKKFGSGCYSWKQRKEIVRNLGVRKTY